MNIIKRVVVNNYSIIWGLILIILKTECLNISLSQQFKVSGLAFIAILQLKKKKLLG